jgi:hypothetical protein
MKAMYSSEILSGFGQATCLYIPEGIILEVEWIGLIWLRIGTSGVLL